MPVPIACPVSLTPEEHARLESLVRAHSTPQALAFRCRLILRTAAPDLWIVVEKILEPGEPLPRDWPVAGTTGYDFLNELGGLFVDPAGEQPMADPVTGHAVARMISPQDGATLPAGAVTFQWCNASADYFLAIETVPGAHDIFYAFAGGPGAGGRDDY